MGMMEGAPAPAGDGAAAAPRYPVPWRTLSAALFAALLDTRRSFRADATACLRRSGIPLVVEGRDLIPTCGPRVLTVNHYHRPGFAAWWIALAVSAVTPAEVRWSITAAWTEAGTLASALSARLSTGLFPRIARVYGFDSLPPMPPRDHEAAARARAVRAVLTAARAQPPPIIGLSPEGQDSPDGALKRPHPGVGRFLLHLSNLGHPIQPVGIYEQHGALHLSFGPPYRLEAPPAARASVADEQAAERVMRALAAQLPPHLRGPFA